MKWTLPDASPSTSVRLRAIPVRHWHDGVGLAFAYQNINSAAWSNLVKESSDLHVRMNAFRMLRFTRALAILCTICTPDGRNDLRAIRDNFAHGSGEAALSVLNTAAELMDSRVLTAIMRVSFSVLNRIL